MKRIYYCFFILLCLYAPLCWSQKVANLELRSPDGTIIITIHAGDSVTWTVVHGNTPVITASRMALQLDNGELLGKGSGGCLSFYFKT